MPGTGHSFRYDPGGLPSGSDRVRQVARQIDAEIYVNIQGDEPTLTPDFFPPLLELFDRPEVEVATLAVRCPPEEFADPNAVKVVTALDGRALYFSRATIPFDRDKSGHAAYRKHLGIYAYRKAALERFAALPPSPLERIERLEQLRLLENGIGLYVAEAPGDTIGVDTEADLARARSGAEGGEQHKFRIERKNRIACRPANRRPWFS